MRIMVVDDEFHVARVLAESVRFQGHEAVVAHSGFEGLSLLSQSAVDAVLLDLVMPHMSGIEVLQEIRRMHPALPVIVVTGHATLAEIDEAQRLGVTEVIAKPFGLRNLGEALARLEIGGA